MKNIKILLVEDDKDQIDWAKKTLTLEGYDVVIFESAVEAAEEMENNEYDIVITDLEIPQLSNQNLKPEVEWGKYVLKEGVKAYMNNKIKGIALVSNYEHHVGNGMEVDIDAFEILGATGLEVKDYYFGPIEFMPKGSKNLNLIIFLDSVVWWKYSMLLESGEVISPEKINRDQNYRLLAKEGKAKMLKPYRQIVEAISKNL